MKQTEDPRIAGIKKGAELGTRAMWGRVGYEGEAFAPHPDTYEVGSVTGAFTTIEDSGLCHTGPSEVANLVPLVAAVAYELGFAWEAGPLSTWRN